MEIEKAVEASDAIIVCLSKGSITKEGYIQRELRLVLDVALTKPEDTIFIIPLRLEECELPRRLRPWQYADYFEGKREKALERLLISLRKRFSSLELKIERSDQQEKIIKPLIIDWSGKSKVTLSNGMEFMRVPAGQFIMGSEDESSDAKPQHIVDIPYDYWMARFPITKEIYNDYAKSKSGIFSPKDDWENQKPVVNVKWTDAMAYCRRLNNLLKTEFPSGLVLRLPTEAEWEKAARGTDGRVYPWGNQFDENKCNTIKGGKLSKENVGSLGPKPVNWYSPQGESPYGCADMLGNVWEWTNSLKKTYPYNPTDGRENEEALGQRVLRGVSFIYEPKFLQCWSRAFSLIEVFSADIGFRVTIALPLPK